MTKAKLDPAGLGLELLSSGFTVVSGAIDHELLTSLTADSDKLIARFDEGYRSPDFWCYEQSGSQLLYRIHNLEEQGAPELTRLFRGGPLHELAASYLGPSHATVCAMVVKTKGAAGVPWHRDRTDVRPGKALNLSVYLDSSDRENGCVEAVRGSHMLPDDANVIAVRDAGPRVPVSARPGDVMVHDVRLVHGSGGNAEGVRRRSIIIEFAASSTFPT